MKNFSLTIIALLLMELNAISCNLPTTYSQNELWGLKDKATEEIITKPIYKKIIPVGTGSWVVQNKKDKYGLIDNTGKTLIPLKYNHADRLVSKFIKLGNFNDYGIYDEFGNTIVEPKFQRVEILYGQMFLTYRNFKYGIIGYDGKTILENEFDDIYMPKPNVMRLKYNGKWYEIEQVNAQILSLQSKAGETIKNPGDLDLKNIVIRTGVVSSYSVLTFSDYVIKVLSTISPSHEDTIDELMLSQGVDTINIFKKMLWLPKYPVVYSRNYYRNLRNPHNGPFSEFRTELLNQTP